MEVTLTHTFGVMLRVTVNRADRFGCPYNDGSTVQSPVFVGDDYYCESTAILLLLLVHFIPMIPYGMDGSVLVWNLLAALTLICPGLQRH